MSGELGHAGVHGHPCYLRWANDFVTAGGRLRPYVVPIMHLIRKTEERDAVSVGLVIRPCGCPVPRYSEATPMIGISRSTRTAPVAGSEAVAIKVPRATHPTKDSLGVNRTTA